MGVVAPYDCLSCGAEGGLLCAGCTQALLPVAERCYRCHKLSQDALTCAACRKLSKLYRVSVSSVYEGVAKDVVWKLKFAGAQAATQQMTARMLPLLQAAPEAVIVPVPTASSRVRRRGYDQAELLARELARKARLPYITGLARTGQAHQVGASRQQRLKQLTDVFHVTKRRFVQDAHVILVDDVVTTGATLEAAAAALKAAGARRVDAIVFAQP